MKSLQVILATVLLPWLTNRIGNSVAAMMVVQSLSELFDRPDMFTAFLSLHTYINFTVLFWIFLLCLAVAPLLAYFKYSTSAKKRSLTVFDTNIVEYVRYLSFLQVPVRNIVGSRPDENISMLPVRPAPGTEVTFEDKFMGGMVTYSFTKEVFNQVVGNQMVNRTSVVLTITVPEDCTLSFDDYAKQIWLFNSREEEAKSEMSLYASFTSKGREFSIMFYEGPRGTEEMRYNRFIRPFWGKHLRYFYERIKKGSSSSWLLHGRPGCGKTSIVRQLAKTLGLCVHTVDLVDYMEQPKDLRKIFMKTGYIILLDELDKSVEALIHLERSQEDQGLKFRWDHLQTVMDGIFRSPDSIVFAATNDLAFLKKHMPESMFRCHRLEPYCIEQVEHEEVCEIFEKHYGRKMHTSVRENSIDNSKLRDSLDMMSKPEEFEEWYDARNNCVCVKNP